MAWLETNDFRIYSPEMKIAPEDKAAFMDYKRAIAIDALRAGFANVNGEAGFRIGRAFTVFDDKPPRVRIANAERGGISKFPEILGAFGTWMVTQRVIDIIEGIEPGVHRYIPVDLRFEDGGPPDEPRWLLNVMTSIESLMLEHSKLGSSQPEVLAPGFRAVKRYFVEGAPSYRVDQGKAERRNLPYPLAVSAEAIKGRALWCERHLRWGTMLVSDALADALEALPRRSGIMWEYYVREI